MWESSSAPLPLFPLRFCMSTPVAATVEWGEASSGCEVEEDGVVFCPGDSGVPNNYAMLDTPLSAGRHSWDVTILEGRTANIAFGVGTARCV